MHTQKKNQAHCVENEFFWGQRPSGEDVCIKMDQIVTVQLGAVGAGEHERTAPSLPSRSGYLVNQYQFNSQILSPAPRIIARLHVWTHLFPNFPARVGPRFPLCVHTCINMRLH